MDVSSYHIISSDSELHPLHHKQQNTSTMEPENPKTHHHSSQVAVKGVGVEKGVEEWMNTNLEGIEKLRYKEKGYAQTNR